MHLTKRGKRRLLIIAGVLVVVGVAIVALVLYRDVYRGQLALEARERGIQAYRDGDYEAALIELQYPLSRDRTDVEALLAYADCRSKVLEVNYRHLAQAAGIYNEVLRLNPANLLALEQLLAIYGRIGYRVEAGSVIDRILAIDPEHVEALATRYAIAFSSLRAGERVEGRPDETARRLIELQPDQLNWYKFLLVYMRINNDPPEDMLALCDGWILGYEEDGRFHLLKAELLIVLGLYDESREEAILAARDGANTLDVLDLMLSLIDKLSLQARADETLAQVRAELLERTRAQFADQPWVYEALIRQHWRLARYDEALVVLDEAEQAVSTFSDRLLRWQALLEMATDGRVRALDALDRLEAFAEGEDGLQRDGNRAWVQALRARLTVAETGWPQVIERLSQAMELSQRDPILQYLLAEAYQNVEEHELAARAYLQAVRFDPLWLTPYLSGARSLLVLGRHGEAIEVLVGLLRRTPNVTVEAYVLFAEAWLASGRGVTDAGLLYDRDGRSIDLLSMLEILYRESAGHPELTRLYLTALLEIGDQQAAANLIGALLEAPEVAVSSLIVAADASRRAGLGLEVACLERARQLEHDALDLVAAQAVLLDEQGLSDEGLKRIDDWLRSIPASDPRAVQGLRLRAAYLVRIEHPEAMAALRELLIRHPDAHEMALFVIATPRAWQDRSLIEAAAEQLARTAGEHSPRVMITRATAVLRYETDDPARLASALSQVSEVIDMTPDSLPALTLMAELLLAGPAPEREQAIDYLRTAADTYPAVWSLYPRLITLLQQEGRYDTAVEYLRRFGLRTDEAETLRRAELSLLQTQGDFETIVVRLRETIDTSSSIEEQLLLAGMYRRIGDPDRAATIYDRLLVLHPQDERIIGKAVDLLVNRSQMQRAAALIESFDASDRPAAKAQLQAAFALKQGDADSARRHFENAIEAEPDQPQHYDRLARHLLMMGDDEGAMAVVQRGLETAPEHEGLRITQALTTLRLGPEQRSRGLELIEALGEAHRDWLDTERLNDRILQNIESTGITNRDLADARGLVERYDQFLPAWRLAVDVHARVGRLPEAIQLARRAAANLPLSAEPDEWTTRLLLQNRMPNEAIDAARQWRSRMLDAPLAADLVLATLMLDVGQVTEAMRQLEPHWLLLERDPVRAPRRTAIWLRALLHAGDNDRALELLRNHQQLREIWYPLSRELEPRYAFEALRYAAALRGETAQEAFILAGEWVALGQRTGEASYYDRAEALVDTIGGEDAQSVPAMLLRASIASGRGNFDAAETHYRRALQQQPNHPGVLNNLAYALLQRNPASVEALTLSAKAVQLAPDNPDLLDTLALALLGSDRLAEAADAATRAVERRSDDPSFRLTLARIRYEQGRMNDAQTQLSRAQRQLNAMPRRDERLMEAARELQRRLQEKVAPAPS